MLRWVAGEPVSRCHLSEHMLPTWTRGETVGPAPHSAPRLLQKA